MWVKTFISLAAVIFFLSCGDEASQTLKYWAEVGVIAVLVFLVLKTFDAIIFRDVEAENEIN